MQHITLSHFLSEIVDAWPTLLTFFEWYIPFAILAVWVTKKLEKEHGVDLRLRNAQPRRSS